MKKSSHSLPLTLGFIAFVILTFLISWKYFESRREQNVSQTDLNNFPVVIVTSDKTEIITTDLLEDFKVKNPSYSFLIPNGKEEFINKQLEKFQIEQHRKGIPHIKVEQISEGKQLIELEILSDGFVISKYEARDKEIKPLTYKMAGSGFIIFPCGITLFIGFMGFFLLRFILWFVKSQKILL